MLILLNIQCTIKKSVFYDLGWEPDKPRNSTPYVRPFENTFKLDPLSCMSGHVESRSGESRLVESRSDELRLVETSLREKVELVIMQHSAARNFDVRMTSRNTWKRFDQR
jgi:hypothetical protein